MDTRFGQFVLWTLLTCALAALAHALVRRRRPDLTPGTFVWGFGPLLVVAWSLHPLLFRVPNNFARIDSGWFAFWFRVRRAMDFDKEWSFILASAVLSLVLALVLWIVQRGFRSRVFEPRAALIAFVFWYLAAQCLRVPGRELIEFAHFTMIDDVRDVPGLFAEEPQAARMFLFPLGLGSAALIVAIVVGLWGSKRSTETPALADE